MRIAFNPSTVAALIAPPNNKDITFDLRGQNIFARGVKFCGTDTNTWRDIKINNVSIGSNTLDLRDGDNTTLTNINGIVTINSTLRPVVDNLTSDSTTSSLSANLGRVLKTLIDGKSDSDHNHDDRYVKRLGDTMLGALNFANGTWNLVGDDSYMGDCNISGHFGIKAANTTYPGIAFFNNANDHLGNLTAYNGNVKYGAYSLQFLDNGNTSVSASTLTNPFSGYNSNAVADGQAVCVWGQSSYLGNLANDTGDMSLWLKRVNANVATLNMVLDGEYYANGNLRLAHVSEIPNSLKNPYALTISLNGTSQGPYDGSAAKNINITPSSIGAATSGHNHDGRYVYNYGGTQMDGASINKNALGMATNSGITGDWWHILQAAWNSEYRWNSLIAFPTLNRNGMYYRSGLDDNTAWGNWIKLLDIGNSYVTGGKGVINGTTITQVDNATNADTVDNYHIADESRQIYRNSYTVTDPAGAWILIKFPAWNANNEIVAIDGYGDNRQAHCVVHCGSRNQGIWGYQSNYNGTVVDRIRLKEVDSGKFAIVALINGGITTLTIKATNSLEISKTTADNAAFAISSSFFSSSGVFHGNVDWDKIIGKPSSFTPSAHTHSWTSITDKIVAGNEFNIVNAGFNGDIWFNYLPINDRSKTASIHTYIMCNGAEGMASVTASGFVKNGSSSSYVLLGDGGHQIISSLSVNYATSAGYANGIANKGLLDSQEKIDNFITANRLEYAIFKTAESNNVGLDANDGMILSIPWDSTKYGAQIAFDDELSATVKVRSKSGSWGNWHTLLHSGNYNSYSPTLTGTGASGTWGINITGNADTVDGAHLIKNGSGTGIKQVYYFGTTGTNTSYIKLGTLHTVSVTGAGTSKVMFTVKGGINYGGTNESVYEVAASTRGSIQVTSTLVRGNRELKFGYVSTSSNVEIWMAYDGSYRGVTEVEVSSSVNFTLAMTETITKPSGFVEGSYRILASTADNVASATKLATARSIWGQSFDGTANVDGTLTISDSGSDDPHIISTVSKWFHIVSNYKLVLYAGDYNSSQHDAINILPNHNVGIGTDPAYKLHVAGDIYSSATIRTAAQNQAIVLSNNSSPAWISALEGQVIFNTGNAIRFGETAWDWNQWAGLKYTHSNKTIYLGIADNSIFNANSALSGGTLNLRAGISNIDLNSGTSIRGLPTDGSPYGSSITLRDASIYLSSYGDISMSTGPGVIKLSSGYGAYANIGSDIKIESSQGVYLNSRRSGNVYLCLGGGNVSIGYSSPSYKLDINGLVRASGFIHNGHNSDDAVLLAGGGYKTLSDFTLTSHNHDGRYVRAFGTSNDNIDSDWGQSFKTFDPIPSGTPPEKNPNISILNIGENFNRRKLLAFIYSNDNIYYRRHVDGGFTNWRRLALINDVNNYYWANVKISDSSSTTTSPTVSNLTATSSIKMGNISLEHTDEINNSTNGSLYLNYRNSGNVSLCQGGGNVGIGTTSPLTALDIRSNEIAPLSVNGAIKLATNPNGTYYYQPICVAIGKITNTQTEYNIYCNTNITCNTSTEIEITFNDIPCYAGELSNYMLFISDLWSDKNDNTYNFVISLNKLKLIIYISGAPYMNIGFIIYKCKDGLTKYTAPFPR